MATVADAIDVVLSDDAYAHLNEDQKRVSRLMFTQDLPVFLTGVAGTGKSTAVRAAVEIAKNLRMVVECVCPTHRAAANLDNASTIHALLGLRPYDQVPENPLGLKSAVLDKLSKIDVLIVDEISMVPRKIVCLLFRLCEMHRDNLKRTLRLLMIGDFAQLTPIDDKDRPEGTFADEEWERNVRPERVVFLTQVYRQEDKEMHAVLSDVRYGLLTRRVKEFVHSHAIEAAKVPPGTVFIYPRRAEVDARNKEAMDKAIKQGADFAEFQANETMYALDPQMQKVLRAQVQTEQSVTLVVGVPVRLTANLRIGSEVVLCNGSILNLVGFAEPALGNPLVQEDGQMFGPWAVVSNQAGRRFTIPYFGFKAVDPATKQVGYVVWQIPLVAGVAATVHAFQGATVDGPLCVSGTDHFAAGQVYVALTRFRKSKNLMILDPFSMLHSILKCRNGEAMRFEIKLRRILGLPVPNMDGEDEDEQQKEAAKLPSIFDRKRRRE